MADPPGFTENRGCLALVLLAARIYFTNWISLFVMVTLGVCALRAVRLILASVTNTMQEAMIGIQLAYMAQLFLSGATFPSARLPTWAQDPRRVSAGFLPGL